MDNLYVPVVNKDGKTEWNIHLDYVESFLQQYTGKEEPVFKDGVVVATTVAKDLYEPVYDGSKLVMLKFVRHPD